MRAVSARVRRVPPCPPARIDPSPMRRIATSVTSAVDRLPKQRRARWCVGRWQLHLRCERGIDQCTAGRAATSVPFRITSARVPPAPARVPSKFENKRTASGDFIAKSKTRIAKAGLPAGPAAEGWAAPACGEPRPARHVRGATRLSRNSGKNF